MKIKIISDSTSDIPVELAKSLEIEIVPLSVNFSDKSYRDGIDLTSEEFFEKLNEAEEMPTTSQVSIGEFVEIFESSLIEHDKIICINLSSELSGTYNAAMQAKEILNNENIYVIDSKLVSFSLGFLVVEVARKIENGDELSTVIEYATEAYKNMQNIFIFDTLEYLLKGGRLSKKEAFIGSLLNIKPVLTLEDGILKSTGKIRGQKKAVKYAVKRIMEDYEKKSFSKIAIFESANSDMMKEIKEIIQNEFDFDEILGAKIGTVVSTHAGPGCVGISYFYE